MCYVDGDGTLIELSEDKSEEYTVIDETPDGSADKPFYVGDEDISVSFDAGETLHFCMRGETRIIRILGDYDFKLTYGEEDFLPEEGAVETTIAGAESIYQVVEFTVTNTAGVEQELTLGFTSLPGTQNNPYIIALDVLVTEELGGGASSYYTANFSGNGYIVVSVDAEYADTSIVINNRTRSTVTEYDPTASVYWLAVFDGDEIDIEVTNSSDETAEVGFTVTFSETAPQ